MEVGDGASSLEGDLWPLRGACKRDVGRKLLLEFLVTAWCAQHVIEYRSKTDCAIGKER